MVQADDADEAGCLQISYAVVAHIVIQGRGQDVTNHGRSHRRWQLYFLSGHHGAVLPAFVSLFSAWSSAYVRYHISSLLQSDHRRVMDKSVLSRVWFSAWPPSCRRKKRSHTSALISYSLTIVLRKITSAVISLLSDWPSSCVKPSSCIRSLRL